MLRSPIPFVLVASIFGLEVPREVGLQVDGTELAGPETLREDPVGAVRGGSLYEFAGGSEAELQATAALRARAIAHHLVLESVLLDVLDGDLSVAELAPLTDANATRGLGWRMEDLRKPCGPVTVPPYETARAFFEDLRLSSSATARAVWGSGFTGGHAHPPEPGAAFHLCVPMRCGCSKFTHLVKDLTDRGVLSDFEQGDLALDSGADGKAYFKVAQVRNPVTRALSAWALWRGVAEHELATTHTPCLRLECKVPKTFAEFVTSLSSGGPEDMDTKFSSNGHWMLQSDACQGDFDYIGKSENRRDWQPNFFSYTNLASSMDVAEYVGSHEADEVTNQAHLAAKERSWCKHLTRAAFDGAVKFYQQDIESLGYRREIESMRETLSADCWK